MAAEAKSSSRVEISMPPIHFFEKAILEMDAEETVQRFGSSHER
jgi:hypothetical protein